MEYRYGAWWATLEPVDVRAELMKTPAADEGPKKGTNHNLSRCYVKFWLQPQVCHNGMWQGGEQLMVKRVSANGFKVGALGLKTLEQATRYVEEYLDRYRVPYHRVTATVTHPFEYSI